MATMTSEHTSKRRRTCAWDHVIEPGDRYRRYAVTPGDDEVNNTGWVHGCECVACAEMHGRPLAGVVGPQAAAVAAFNATFPVGTEVRYWTGFREGPGVVSRTTCEAWMSASHTAAVRVEGHGAYISLTHIEPLSKENP
jgi:hypothetical protein